MPPEKVISRYGKALKLVPHLQKRKDKTFYWVSEYWDKKSIEELVGMDL